MIQRTNTCKSVQEFLPLLDHLLYVLLVALGQEAHNQEFC